MVFHEKKQGGIIICVYLRKMNDLFLHDPFPTPFTNEVLKNVRGQEAYSFTDKFSGYHQINIESEDRYKTTFSTEWVSYKYTVLLFELKNVPTIFSRIVIATFKESIHQFIEVYLDDWIVYSLLKECYHWNFIHKWLQESSISKHPLVHPWPKKCISKGHKTIQLVKKSACAKDTKEVCARATVEELWKRAHVPNARLWMQKSMHASEQCIYDFGWPSTHFWFISQVDLTPKSKLNLSGGLVKDLRVP
jgi:hypothetical protein